MMRRAPPTDKSGAFPTVIPHPRLTGGERRGTSQLDGETSIQQEGNSTKATRLARTEARGEERMASQRCAGILRDQSSGSPIDVRIFCS
eukprot:scaffold113_cov339-Pavlova_lutheri.AAC.19